MSSSSDLPRVVHVLDPTGTTFVDKVSRHRAEHMIEKRQARRKGTPLLMMHYYEMPEPLNRTRVARRGPLAAMGMSQEYTRRNERGRVDGFKTIYPEDAHFFRQAVSDIARVGEAVASGVALYSLGWIADIISMAG